MYATARMIANPAAGRGTPDLIAELTAACREHVAEVSVTWTSEPGSAVTDAAAAVRDRTDVVIAVGGDGTVREVVRGLLQAGRGAALPSLLILPGGTGNSTFLGTWGGWDWPQVVPAALTGQRTERRLLDLARLQELDELVLLGTSTGLIAEALVTARRVSVSGRDRYQIALAATAADFEPYPGRVWVDGELVHTGPTVFVNVGGGQHRGGRYQLLPNSLLDDGELDVCVVGGDIRPEDVPALTLDGGHLGTPGVSYGRGRII